MDLQGLLPAVRLTANPATLPVKAELRMAPTLDRSGTLGAAGFASAPEIIAGKICDATRERGLLHSGKGWRSAVRCVRSRLKGVQMQVSIDRTPSGIRDTVVKLRTEINIESEACK